ncbi:hypothetical protein BH23CHL8_BH23CHL8_18870 [soil metagenome]
MLLCDAVQEANGKLFILGGGWTYIGPEIGPMGVAILMEVPWADANKKHHFKLTLCNTDMAPVAVGPEGQIMQMEGEIEVGRPPGAPVGNPFMVPLALNVAPLPLAPDARFLWVLEVDGDTSADWQLGFNTRPR